MDEYSQEESVWSDFEADCDDWYMDSFHLWDEKYVEREPLWAKFLRSPIIHFDQIIIGGDLTFPSIPMKYGH